MKILVIGLDGAPPELLLGDERLTNFRRLMHAGCFGRLESVVPPLTIPAWMCMATSQDPGSLGVYGCHNRMDYTYSGFDITPAHAIQPCTIWNQLARLGKRSILMGVPPSYPSWNMDGECVNSLLTPEPLPTVTAYPPALHEQITTLMANYPTSMQGFHSARQAWLPEELYAVCHHQFTVLRHLVQHAAWDYFQFVEMGLDRLQHGFWQFHDPQHIHYAPGNPYAHVIGDYYLHLDAELGQLLEVLPEDTVVLVLSHYGAQRLDGGFCVNEWLVRQGLLVLNEYPKQITPLSKLNVNWDKTKAWSAGGSYAPVFCNVKDREPNGAINQTDYEAFRNDLKAKLEATVDDQDHALGTLVFKPDEVYTSVRNVAPDLIVYVGGLYWCSRGEVGYPSIYTREPHSGLDGCNHAQFGSFILAAPNHPLSGEIEGAQLLDMAPTLLELAGYDIPPFMQGQSLLAHQTFEGRSTAALAVDEAERLHERLRGLGYIP